jgi:hypothetical protein
MPIGSKDLLLPSKVLFILHLDEVLAWVGVDTLEYCVNVLL